jgi:hypothetical protein
MDLCHTNDRKMSHFGPGKVPERDAMRSSADNETAHHDAAPAEAKMASQPPAAMAVA